jgi:hypothetical protein
MRHRKYSPREVYKCRVEVAGYILRGIDRLHTTLFLRIEDSAVVRLEQANVRKRYSWPAGRLSMQRVNEFDFFQLAQKIHPLTTLKPSVKLTEIWLDFWNARLAINEIFAARPLNVCAGAAVTLLQSITAVVPEKWEDVIALWPPDINKEEAVPVWKIDPIQKATAEFVTILAAECQVLDTYFVSKKGTYSTADLVDHAHYQIPPTLRKSVPAQTKADVDQAGKCIAFDLSTAAAFHLLRGTEAVLREYYDRVVPGPKKAGPKMRNWGVYIKLLKEHGAEVKITSLLDHLRDAYRNPVLHPEENYTDESAQVLFGVCISAIVMMTDEIARLELKGGLLPLTEMPILPSGN